MADESIIKKALDLARKGQEFVFPHASKNPFAPMAYVKDFNEFFLPSAQMAIDELQGEEEYPAWAYGLASLPVVGKVGKVAGKVAKKAGKGAANKAVNTARFQELYNEALKSAEEFGYYNPADKMRFAKDVATSNYLDEFNIIGELPEEIKAFRNGIKMTESVPKAGGKKESWQATLDDVQKFKDHSARMIEMDELFELGKDITPEQFARYNAIREVEGLSARDMESFLKEWEKAYGEASPEWTLVKE